MRHRVRVDLQWALEATEELRMMWHHAQQFPESPAFGGGVLSDWPAIAVDAFAVLNHEMLMINAYRDAVRSESTR